MASTSDRLKQIMKERGLKQVDIVRMCQPFCEKYGERLERNDLSQYVSGKVIPGQRKLTILSEALDVSEPWLMGFDVPRDDTEAEFTALYSKMTRAQKKLAVSILREILENR